MISFHINIKSSPWPLLDKLDRADKAAAAVLEVEAGNKHLVVEAEEEELVVKEEDQAVEAEAEEEDQAAMADPINKLMDGVVEEEGD